MPFAAFTFASSGRIQLKYDAGLWNEWYILFDDQRSGWLSEAGGEYIVSSPVQVESVDGSLPAFETLKPEMPVTVAGRIFFRLGSPDGTLYRRGGASCRSRSSPGYDVNTADLRGNDRFVTIDYSETPPLVFVGYPAPFDELKLANLRGRCSRAG